jgi:mono/diheme cytochrome c family protein
MSHAHEPHALPHSHKKHYIILGVILSIVTFIELGIPLIKGVPDLWTAAKEVWAPLLVVLSVFKFGAVVGDFMHMRGDVHLYKILFISPLLLATISFFSIGSLSVVHYAPFGKGYAITAQDLSDGYVPPTSGGSAEPPLADDKFEAAFVEAKTAGFAKGKETFTTSCANCHRADGGGMPGLGVNLTDDCYKHGSKIAALYTTITKGVSGTAMPAWQTSMDSEKMRQVAYYVRSLKGSNVAGGKECEGTKE